MRIMFRFNKIGNLQNQMHSSLRSAINHRMPTINASLMANRLFSNFSSNCEQQINADKEDNVASKYKSKAMQRFWKNVSLNENKETNSFELCLDGKPMKTPSRNVMSIPIDKEIVANLVASEWEGQDKFVKKHSLPMTSLVVRAVDDFSDNIHYREGVIDALIQYLHTDSVCYFQDYPESFVKMQSKYWASLLDWINKDCGLNIKFTNSIQSVKQSDEVISYFKDELLRLDPLSLAAFEKGVMTTKSFIIPYALFQNPNYSVEDAATAARLEQLHQIERWGEVEDSHDVERERLKRDLSVIRIAWI